MYAKIENGVVVQYPYSYEDLKRENPQTSFPTSMPIERLNDYGIHIVVVTGQPEHDRIMHTAVEGTPALIDGKWKQTWEVRELNATESAQNLAAYVQRVQAEVVAGTQARLDAWANERNYDGILSLCTYATSSVQKFAAEGQRGVDNRDATWSTLYGVLAEVEGGTRPMPSGYADIEPLLPVLTWPV